MRYSPTGLIGRDHDGRALATFLRDPATGALCHFFQQPVVDTDRNGPWEMALRPIDAAPGRGARFGPDGANFWASAGDVWVTEFTARTPRLKSSDDVIGTDRLLDVAPDGSIATQSDDMLTMRTPDGTFTRPSVVSPVTRYIDDLLTWIDASGRVCVRDTASGWDMAPRQLGGPAAHALAFYDANDTAWVTYSTDALGGVLHRLADASQGYRYGTPGAIYNPDWCPNSIGGKLGWSVDKSEFGQQELVIDTLGLGMVPLSVPTPPPVTITPPAGPFAFMGTFGIEAAPGNMNVVGVHPTKAGIVMVEDLPQVTDQSRLLGLWVAHERPNPKVGISAEITLDERIAQCRPIAERLRVPMFVYDDQRVYRTGQIAAWCGSTPWVAMPQWYIGAGESPDTFEADIRAQVTALGARWFLPVIRITTGSGSIAVDTVLRGLNACAAVINTRLVSCVGAALFAYNRADGAVSDPRLRAAADAWLTVQLAVSATNARTYAATFYPPIEAPTMNLTPEERATIVRFANAYPIPQGDPGTPHEDRCRVWNDCLAEQMVAIYGARFGSKSAGPGRPRTKDVLAHRVGSTFGGWDILTGVGTGAPRLNTNPSWIDLTGQEFVPMRPVDRLGRRSARPALPAEWRAMSAFDLAARVAVGDQRWLDDPQTRAVPIHRVMVARRSGDNPRTSAEGVAQLTGLLSALRSNGRPQRLYVTLICDSKDLSKDDIRTLVRNSNAAMLASPDQVAAVELANEIGHSSQNPALYDIAFLEELDAMVDTRWPLAWGGEFEGGSFVDLHSDRGTSPAGNGVVMARRQAASGKDVVDGEALGVAEPANVPNRQRTDDPTYPAVLVRVARQRALKGVTVHMDAGLSANVDDFGPVQREALRQVLTEWGVGTSTPLPPTPPPTPSGVLDAPLPGPISDYASWLALVPMVAAIEAWVVKGNGGAPMLPEQLLHVFYRATFEGRRWGTLRTALREWMPGGE